MSISCKEELQVKLDLLSSEEIKVKFLDEAGCYASHLDGWFIVTDDGECNLINDRFEFDDIKKVKAINKYMFRTDIKKIKIPDCVTTLKVEAFICCDKLTSMMIPNCVTNIERYAFQWCSSLVDVMIGTGVSSIGCRAFRHCNQLERILFKGKTLKQVKSMRWYPWGIKDESIIHAELE